MSPKPKTDPYRCYSALRRAVGAVVRPVVEGLEARQLLSDTALRATQHDLAYDDAGLATNLERLTAQDD